MEVLLPPADTAGSNRPAAHEPAIPPVPAGGHRRRNGRLQLRHRRTAGNRGGHDRVRPRRTTATRRFRTPIMCGHSKARTSKPASLAVNGIDPLSPAAPGAAGKGRARPHLHRSAHRHENAGLPPRRAGGPQRRVRSRFPQCRRGARRDQAQSVSPVLVFRHGNACRRGVRPDRAREGGAGVWDRLGFQRGAFGASTMPNAPPMSSARCATRSTARGARPRCARRRCGTAPSRPRPETETTSDGRRRFDGVFRSGRQRLDRLSCAPASVSSFLSSPLRCMSSTMSQPPTSSPFT